MPVLSKVLGHIPGKSDAERLLKGYTVINFISDLHKAFQLPSYFGKDAQSYFSESNLKEEQDVPLLQDFKLASFVSLVENIILFGHGKLTDTFMSILISQKEYSKQQYQLTDRQMPPKERNKIKGLIPYESLKCFMSLAQENLERFTVTADRLASVFKETGTSENPAGKKLF